jgi:hypothetical protein
MEMAFEGLRGNAFREAEEEEKSRAQEAAE